MMPIVKKSEFVNVRFGENVTVIEPCNLYGCEVGENAFIGPFVEIQSNVVIGASTRIQSHSFICSGVEIGKDCFIGHGVMFVNDKWSEGRSMGDKNKWGKTSIGNNVLIGSNSTILPVEICADVIIGAGSVVTRSILSPGKYAGNPARKVG
jgi:acetyltransferase-like isoleucine patch superfamily enzyme